MRRWRLVLLAAGAAVLLVASSPLLLARIAAERVGAALGADVDLGSLAWNPFAGRWVATDVRVAGKSGTSVARARRVRMRLDLRDLLTGTAIRLRDVVVEAPHVTLRREGDAWALDLPAGEAEASADSGWPSVSLEGVKGHHGTVTLVGPEDERTVVRVKHVRLRGASGASGVQGHVRAIGRMDDASFELRSSGRLWTAGHRIRLQLRAADVPLAPTLAMVRVDPGREIAGRVALSGVYDDAAHGKHRHRTVQGRLTANEVRVGAGSARGLDVAHLAVSRLRIDVERGAITLDRVDVKGGEIRLRRLPEGVRVAGLIEPGQTDVGPSPWRLGIAAIAVRDLAVRQEGDAGVQTAATLTELRAGPIGPSGQPVPLALAAELPSGGQLHATGTVSPRTPMTLRMKVIGADVVLSPLVVAAGLPVGIETGRASGSLQVMTEGGRTQIEGVVVVDDLKTVPAAGDRPEHVLACKRIEIAIDRAELQPLRGSLARVALEWPYVFVDRTAAGLFPLSLVPRTDDDGRPPPAADTLRIRDVTVTGGRVDFRDETLAPPYWRSLANVTVRARDLSAPPVRIPRLTVDGLVDELSPLHVEGNVGARTELRVDAKHVALPPFNAYLQDVSSYAVSSGLAEVHSEIVIERSALEATNRVVLSRLGVQSGGRDDTLQEQIGLPLTLAIALMKDYRGDIALALPVRGDLASPTFSVRSAVWQAVVQAIQGAVLSPLNALGRVFLRDGRIERFALEPVPFQPGSRTLDATGSSRVAQVARVLQTRPDLALEIRGTVASADVERLQAGPALTALEASRGGDALRNYLRARLAGEAAVELSPEDRSRLDTLIQGFPWPDAEARALAIDRSQIVAATLAVDYGLGAERFAVSQPAVDPAALAATPGAVLVLQER